VLTGRAGPAGSTGPPDPRSYETAGTRRATDSPVPAEPPDRRDPPEQPTLGTLVDPTVPEGTTGQDVQENTGSCILSAGTHTFTIATTTVPVTRHRFGFLVIFDYGRNHVYPGPGGAGSVIGRSLSRHGKPHGDPINVSHCSASSLPPKTASSKPRARMLGVFFSLLPASPSCVWHSYRLGFALRHLTGPADQRRLRPGTAPLRSQDGSNYQCTWSTANSRWV